VANAYECSTKVSLYHNTLTHHRSLHLTRHHLTTPRIVSQNITSALILEDDIDWDIRIKPQLTTFARAARLLLQPRQQTPTQILGPAHPTTNSRSRSQQTRPTPTSPAGTSSGSATAAPASRAQAT
jgi:hypothetical protein